MLISVREGKNKFALIVACLCPENQDEIAERSKLNKLSWVPVPVKVVSVPKKQTIEEQL
jgi:hypothetical protein